jgi:hypothetical protein
MAVTQDLLNVDCGNAGGDKLASMRVPKGVGRCADIKPG